MKTRVSLKYFVKGCRNITNTFKKFFANEIYCKEVSKFFWKSDCFFFLNPISKSVRGFIYVQKFFPLIVHHRTIFDPFIQRGFWVFPKIKVGNLGNTNLVQIWSKRLYSSGTGTDFFRCSDMANLGVGITISGTSILGY